MDLEHTLLKLGAAALAAAFWQKVAFWAVLGLAGTWIGIPAAPPLGALGLAAALLTALGLGWLWLPPPRPLPPETLLEPPEPCPLQLVDLCTAECV